MEEITGPQPAHSRQLSKKFIRVLSSTTPTNKNKVPRKGRREQRQSKVSRSSALVFLRQRGWCSLTLLILPCRMEWDLWIQCTRGGVGAHKRRDGGILGCVQEMTNQLMGNLNTVWEEEQRKDVQSVYPTKEVSQIWYQLSPNCWHFHS